MKKLIPFFLLLFSGMISAQNLVVNGGFEEMKTKKTQYAYFSRNANHGWSRPSDGTSDYFYFQPKQKHAYYQAALPHPYEGNAYAGYIAMRGTYEYLEGTLQSPLKKGEAYTICIAVATNDSLRMDPDRLGFFFSNKKNVYYDRSGMLRLPWKPQVTLKNASAERDSGKWEYYTIPYTAKGGERCFVIGDFSKKQPNLLTRNFYYFYVDAISICEGDVPIPDDTDVAAQEDFVIGDTLPHYDSVIAPGKTLVAGNIYFETGKSTLLASSYPPLYTILAAMKSQPEMKVEIDGHTDSDGDPLANQKLSEDRAKAVADFFIENGIDPSRISWKGFGSTRPVSDDKSRNRRVEFVFL